MPNHPVIKNAQQPVITSLPKEILEEGQNRHETWNTLYAKVAARLGEDGKQLAKTTLLTEVIERLSMSESSLEKLKQSTIKDTRDRIDSQAALLSELQAIKLGFSRYAQSLGGIGRVELFMETKLMQEGVLDDLSHRLSFLSESYRDLRADMAVHSQHLEEARLEARTASADARAVQADLDHRLQMNTVSTPWRFEGSGAIEAARMI